MSKINKDFVQYFLFSNGVEKVIIFGVVTITIGLGASGKYNDTMELASIIIMEAIILMTGVAICGLFFYFSYASYQNFVNGKKCRIVGWKEFMKSFDDSFWDGKSTANIHFKVEARDTNRELWKSIADFLEKIINDSKSKHTLGNFEVSKYSLKGSITIGASSNFILKEFIYHLNTLYDRFQTSELTLIVSASPGKLLGPGGDDSADETWSDMRYRQAMERESHDRDFGSDHPHHH